jgi:hypothetical protein
MIKVLAVGDVHGMWAELWSVLRAASVVTPAYEPTEAVVSGRYRVVLVGDLVHYKDQRAYAVAVGADVYDPADPDHLRRAARAQIRELYRFKDFVEKTDGHLQIILGNHDEAALLHNYDLGTRGGLKHDEFRADRGGVALPDDLAAWFRSFPREVVHHGVHFAHAGPTPGMQYFDDFFYHDPDTKTWWYEKPQLVQQSGHRFGVYGHTVMKDGVYIDKEHSLAMIDALAQRQFLEMIVGEDRLDYTVSQV